MPAPAGRSVIETKVRVDGRPATVQAIRSPTIDDVVIAEGRLYLASLDRADPAISSGHRVPIEVRDYLVRLGVER